MLTEGSKKSFVFKDHPLLNHLLEDVLFEVETWLYDSNSWSSNSVSADLENSQKIKISPNLKERYKGEQQDYSWECWITIPESVNSFDKDKWDHELPLYSPMTENLNQKNKRILIKKCSEHRSKDSTGKKVVANVDLSLVDGITSEEQLLNTLFAWENGVLYSVEKEVINKDVKFTVSDPVGKSDKTATISATGLESNHKWSCDVSMNSENLRNISQSNLKEHIEAKLSDSYDQTRKANKKALVKFCAKNRNSTSTDTIVHGSTEIILLDRDSGIFGFEELKLEEEKWPKQ